MYAQMNGEDSRLDTIEWPKYDEKYLATDTIKIAVQVNGKLRGEVEADKDADQAAVEKLAMDQPNVARFY